MSMITVRASDFAGLDAADLYALLRLRVDVFVVEQDCPYPELDGRDTEPGTLHVWASEGDRVLGCLRVLEEDGGTVRIGRVATAPEARGRGVAGRLLEAALERIGPREAVLDAQTRVRGLYTRYGFAEDGPEFLEDGIPHTPMRRSAP
ncbi:GNAT family N-acetyltransferase [Nocardiopsis chromatogenes]|uniref:GNAT family N-acetyltransferase n=1 Tax=Nocardiopsis chromatogenes TaxID=280239 RepID=UPI00037371AA|nr:GNAT family N-acetyltransferase [Nocardiopsis chromatogenes]